MSDIICKNGGNIMEIERKYMSKFNWKRVLKQEYIIGDFLEKNLKGKVSLLCIKEVTSPCYKKYNKISIKIADNNYYWLQIGIENANYWITAMYDKNKDLIQFYIDITKKNYIQNQIDPFFEDLFLDLVILNNDIYILDEDELKQALKEKIIDTDDYLLAYNVVNKLKDYLHMNKEFLINVCEKYFQKLYKKMEQNKKISR